MNDTDYLSNPFVKNVNMITAINSIDKWRETAFMFQEKYKTLIEFAKEVSGIVKEEVDVDDFLETLEDVPKSKLQKFWNSEINKKAQALLKEK